ncbi:MAG: trypsin-like peptidase domain-containing protein [Patescibacteria group bacterium]|nr:trypsin-like peptidase domain-containing protein [Patescibacteria group bacterium]MDE2438370.1 trypsin-like peptidase domain-containing protein [Patescibacteria group bacterium]
MRRVILLCFAWYLIVGEQPAYAQISTCTATQKAYQCTYLIGSGSMTIGSAWIVATPKKQGIVVLTAAHWIPKEDQRATRPGAFWITHPAWPQGTRVPLTLLDYDIRADIALLISPPRYHLPGLSLANTPLYHYDRVVFIKNGAHIPPHTPTFVWFLGTSTIRMRDHKNTYEQRRDIFLAHPVPFCSGAPILNSRGRVVAMMVELEWMTHNHIVTNFGLGVTLRALKTFLYTHRIH